MTERRIIPTTWRENGVGVLGSVGPFAYRAYLLNGLDATGFSPEGLRGGRQKGSRALASDFGFAGRPTTRRLADASISRNTRRAYLST